MPSDNTIVLTQACYSYQDYVDALRACIDPDPAALIGHELVYDDLLGAFIYEMNSRNLTTSSCTSTLSSMRMTMVQRGRVKPPNW